MLAKTPMPKKKPADPSELTPDQLDEISGGGSAESQVGAGESSADDPQR